MFLTCALRSLTLTFMLTVLLHPDHASGQDKTYAETKGYQDVLAAVSRLGKEGNQLPEAVRQKLVSEGQSLIKLEESYKPGTTPIQKEIKKAEDKSSKLADERKALEARTEALRNDPNRTQAQIDALQADIKNYNDRQMAHATYLKDLNARVDADNLRLETAYDGFVQRVKAAFAANPATHGTAKVQVDDALKHLRSASTGTQGTGECAKAIRLALEAGGFNSKGHPEHARQYGPFLKTKGFIEVPSANYSPQKGDIVVIQPYSGGHPSGHIAMYDGSAWISDFKQNDFWGGPGYRQKKPAHAFYRP